MKVVYLLQHLHTLPNGEEDVKNIGIYSSKQAAIDATKRLGTQPGFCDIPEVVEDGDGFYICGYTIDEDNWTQGYISSDDA